MDLHKLLPTPGFSDFPYPATQGRESISDPISDAREVHHPHTFCQVVWNAMRGQGR